MTYKQLLLSAHGRIGRKSYWIGVLLTFVISFIASFLLSLAISVIRGQGEGSSDIAAPIVQLAMIYPSVCIATKRLHDLGRSGWWQAPVFGLWAAGAAVWGLGDLGIGGSLLILAGLTGLALLIFTGFVAGAPEPNRFGSPEQAREKSADVFA